MPTKKKAVVEGKPLVREDPAWGMALATQEAAAEVRKLRDDAARVLGLLDTVSVTANVGTLRHALATLAGWHGRLDSQAGKAILAVANAVAAGEDYTDGPTT